MVEDIAPAIQINKVSSNCPKSRGLSKFLGPFMDLDSSDRKYHTSTNLWHMNAKFCSNSTPRILEKFEAENLRTDVDSEPPKQLDSNDLTLKRLDPEPSFSKTRVTFPPTL